MFRTIKLSLNPSLLSHPPTVFPQPTPSPFLTFLIYLREQAEKKALHAFRSCGAFTALEVVVKHLFSRDTHVYHNLLHSQQDSCCAPRTFPRTGWTAMSQHEK